MTVRDYKNIGERVFTERLLNGLQIFVVQKPDYNKSMAFFATNYGGADRRFMRSGEWIDTPMGVAHFLEHKMFDTPKGNALTDLSANGASANAFTSHSMTAYHFTSTDKFDENLKILLDFVSVPYFTEESVSKEQGIIGQEIRMTEDEPDHALYYGLMRCLFESSPIRDSIAGTVDSIAEITSKTLYDCHKVFYNPSNMALCVVGNVDPESVIKTASDILPKEASIVPKRDYGNERFSLPINKKEHQHMEVSMPMFLMGGKVTPSENILRQEITGELAMEALLGRSTPLYAELYARGLITPEFSGEFEYLAGSAYTVFGGESREPDAVCDAVLDRAKQIAVNSISDETFTKVKKAAIGRCLRGLNSFDNICYNKVSGYFKGYDAFDSLKTINELSKDELVRFISENITADKMAMSLVTSNN